MTGVAGNRNRIAAARLALGLLTRITVLPGGKSAVTSRHPALDLSLCAAVLRFWTNAISVGPAESSGAAEVISRSPAPSNSAFKSRAISSTRKLSLRHPCMIQTYAAELCQLIHP